MGHTVPLYVSSADFSAAFWAAYAAWIATEMWIFSRDRRAARGKKRDAGTLFVFLLVFGPGVALAFTAAWIVPDGHIPLPPAPLFWTGIALVWAGVVFRLWAVLTLGKFFRVTVFVHDDHRLVTAGPYRWLRHPSYTGALVTVIGVTLAMGNWVSVLIGVGALLIAYAFRIPAEEKALGEQFGAAFAEYRKGRSALIPFVW